MNRWKAAALGLALVTTIGHAVAAPATAATGTVNVTGTNNSVMTVSFDDATAAFGTTLTPDGVDSDSSDTVVDFQGSSGNEGSYYVWRAAGSGVAVTVKSNATWNGTIGAAANSGTATSLAVPASGATGALRWCEGSAPTSYATAAACNGFTTTAASWKSSVSRGVNTYTQFYALRADWNDDLGTFISTVTYTVTP
jgi:hypothetical protein